MTAEGCVVVPEELPVERPADWRHGAEDSEHGANRRRASARRDTVPLPLTLTGRDEMSLGTILLITLVLMLIGAFPSWPHSRGWGYGPSGGLGLVVVILIVLLLMGRL